MYIDILSQEPEASLDRLRNGFAGTSYEPRFFQISQYTQEPSGAYQQKVLYVSARKRREVSALVEQHNLVFNLLICDSERVLRDKPLISRCAAILMLPADATTLDEALSDALSSCDEGSDLLALAMNYVGDSLSVRRLLRLVERVSRYDAPVLVNGETGTGKEIVARGIHYESMRRDYSFVPVNCGALTDDLLISELFGHEPGAFTDAKRQRVGLVAQASQGTLFLDEVDALSIKAQTAILRFIQDQEYRPLGSEAVLRSDVRIICATNRDLSAMVAAGQFREDLYYRLKILDVRTPALRERREDIPLLIQHFMEQICRKYQERAKALHPITEQWMTQDYNWPGNVRELENYLHRVFILSLGRTIYVPEVMGAPLVMKGDHIRPSPEVPATLGRFQEAKAVSISRFEREYLKNLMQFTHGNVSEAARISGKERRALGRLLKKHGIISALYKAAIPPNTN